jgi:hypothetical protein
MLPLLKESLLDCKVGRTLVREAGVLDVHYPGHSYSPSGNKHSWLSMMQSEILKGWWVVLFFNFYLIYKPSTYSNNANHRTEG